MSTVTRSQSSNVKFGIAVFAILIGAIAWWHSPRISDRPSPETPRVEPAVPRTNPAVQRIMDTYGSLSDRYLNAPHDITPAQYAAALGGLCDVLERQDMTGCPKDFRVACEQNIRAMRDTQNAVQQYPDGFVEAVATGALNYWTRGETDGGATRLHEDVKAALRRVRATSDEVERVAAKYTE